MTLPHDWICTFGHSLVSINPPTALMNACVVAITSGTHSTTRWMCGPCLQITKVGLEPTVHRLPVSYSIGAPSGFYNDSGLRFSNSC